MGLQDFTVLDKLGKGTFATVFKVRRQSDQKIYAMKQIQIDKLDQKALQNSLNQIRFLASFDSPHIITYHQAFFEEKQSLLCIVMEYAEGGDLLKKINCRAQLKKNDSERKVKKSGYTEDRFKEVEIWKALISITNGIQYLHAHSILHRDIKPQNIFITASGQYKLGDLNVSRLKDPSQLAKLTQTGTPYYASPQVWKNEQYDQKSDVWSIGCAIYHMAALKPPFINQNLEKLYKEVLHGKLKPLPQSYSNQLCEIIKKCLEKNPANRPSIKQIKQNWTVKMYENLISVSQIKKEEQKDQGVQLLKTINMPNNKNLLQENLPKSNYKHPKILDEIDLNEKIEQYTPKKVNERKEQPKSNNNKPITSNQQKKSTKSEKYLQLNFRKRRSLPRTQLSSSKQHSLSKPSKKQDLPINKPQCKENTGYKAIIMSKLPEQNNYNKNKIVQEFFNAKMAHQRVKSIINRQSRPLSRKNIFERIRSAALL